MSKIASSWSAYDKPIHYQEIEYELQRLAGKVLTIVDTIPEARQNKAVKDLIRSAFSDAFVYFQKQSSDGKAGHSVFIKENN